MYSGAPATSWTVVSQAPPSMGFPRQEYWSGLSFPPPGDLPDPGTELGSPTLQADSTIRATRESWGQKKSDMAGLFHFHFLSLQNNSCLGKFSGGSAGKESACNMGDPGSIPGLRRSPGEGNGYPLQYSCLENSMGWWATVHGVAKSQGQLSDLHFYFQVRHKLFFCYVEKAPR